MIRSFKVATCALALALPACAPSAQDAFTPPDYAPPNYATAPLDLSTPEATAYSMMIAMYRGDADMVDQVFAPDGVLRRLRPTGEIEADGLPKWRAWVDTLEVGQANETLFNLKVEQYDRLATVWAPFVIDYNGETVGCGVNQFTMAKMETATGDEGWRIVSGIDVQADKGECAGFGEG
jgi:hypothetical protein